MQRRQQMFDETYYLKALFGGGDRMDWLSVIVLLILVAICVFKPDRVHSHGFFRWSCTFYVLSFLLPSISRLTLEFIGIPSSSMGALVRGVEPEFGIVHLVMTAIQPGFLGLSMFCLFAAIAPRRPTTSLRTSNSPEKKHPLD